MRIVHVAPEAREIPPTAWGGVGQAVWDLKLALEKHGHEVLIINSQDRSYTLETITRFQPHFVHIHTDIRIDLYREIQVPCAITSQFPYIDRLRFYTPAYARTSCLYSKIQPNVFCVSERIRGVYRNFNGIPEHKLFLTPNGVNLDCFEISDNPRYPDRSIYLGKIHRRKRQHLFQGIRSLWFAGGLVRTYEEFDPSVRYLGEWNKEILFSSLTHYGNLVLLSSGEAHALVCMEALASGLGLVVSEWATANLDSSKKFISVIPEKKIRDTRLRRIRRSSRTGSILSATDRTSGSMHSLSARTML